MDAELASWGWPKFRGKQLRQWVFDRLVTDPAAMTDFSKSNREELLQKLQFLTATVLRRQDSSDGTRKLLLGWPDGATAETVMIPDGDRRTACVSSQVGCPVGCKFCASGLNGMKGNLTGAQIVEQIFWLNKIFADEGQPEHRITNVVFMGMGEPMSNYANVMAAVRVLHDPECLNIGARRITISTVGVPAKMRDLAEEDLPINLAISLHAPNEPLRKQLIPWAEHFSLDEILGAARHYFDRTGREITLEYILLASVNDRPEHARELVKICRSMRANVNLIRYNEVEGLPFGRPKSDDVVQFQDILREAGVNAHVRKSRGRDIDAACGQLRRMEQESKLIPLGVLPSVNPVPVRAGFSIVEFLVLIGVVALLGSIFVPYLARTREMDRRTRCARNLANFAVVLREYAKQNNFLLPSVVYDAAGKPNGYTGFTGADDPNPFAAGTTVSANDVTASLFLLMREGYISDGREIGLSLYICPSSNDVADRLTNAAGRQVTANQRSNFRSAGHLSYGYCSPFSSAAKFRLNTDWLDPTFAVMADKGPGAGGPIDDIAFPAFDAPPLEMSRGNSNNHENAGQNVLYGDGHVSFERTPYCGYHDKGAPDNIFTAAATGPTTLPMLPVPIKGYFGRHFAPSNWGDSYIVPSEHDRD